MAKVGDAHRLAKVALRAHHEAFDALVGAKVEDDVGAAALYAQVGFVVVAAVWRRLFALFALGRLERLIDETKHVAAATAYVVLVVRVGVGVAGQIAVLDGRVVPRIDQDGKAAAAAATISSFALCRRCRVEQTRTLNDI